MVSVGISMTEQRCSHKETLDNKRVYVYMRTLVYVISRYCNYNTNLCVRSFSL
jgi:hypothetical protein